MKDKGPWKERRQEIAKRWRQTLFKSALFTPIVLILLWSFNTSIKKALGLPFYAIPLLVIAALAIIAAYHRKQLSAFLGLRHLISYPPIWTTCLITASFILILAGAGETVGSGVGLPKNYAAASFLLGCILLLTTFCLILISYVIAALERPVATQEAPLVEGLSDIATSFDRLREWIADDTPIEEENEDVFGHHRLARRIASRLAWEKPPAQAIVGRLGSGKTVLKNLVTSSLKTTEGGARIRIVPVELWPYETPRAAVEGTLRTLVDSLSKEVNVLEIRGLPQAYSETMSALGGIWSVFARLMGTSSNPFETLARIDEIATAINIRFVVWVEDLERFAGGVPESANEKELIADENRLSPIRALLYGLDQLRSVTVITATTTLRLRFDLEKIARFVEEVPELPTAEVSRILKTFRDGCMDDGFIDPASPSARKEMEPFDNPEQLEMFRSMVDHDEEVYGAAHALAVICRTPRTMKHGLRACLYAWKHLRGEVDFDDVLLMSVLRDAEPNAFALIRQYTNVLRAQNQNDVSDRRNERQNIKRKTFKQALDELRLDPLTRAAIDEIIKVVFQRGDSSDKPQGFARKGGVDYWKRFLSIAEIKYEERDQPVLETMLAEDDVELIELLEKMPQSDTVERFAHTQIFEGEDLLGTDRLVGLFLPWVERRLGESQLNWHDRTPTGLIPLWRLWMRRSERGALKPDTVLQQVKRAYDISVSKNLGLVAEIEHYFVASEGVHNMLAGNQISHNAAAKEYLRTLLVAEYSGKPAKLKEALKGTRGPTLYWLSWGLDRARANDTTGLPFNDWSAFAETILEATRLDPEVMLPQLAAFVVDETRMRSPDFDLFARFDGTLAEKLFGSTQTVLDFFKKGDPETLGMNSQVKAVVNAALKK